MAGESQVVGFRRVFDLLDSVEFATWYHIVYLSSTSAIKEQITEIEGWDLRLYMTNDIRKIDAKFLKFI
jgi:hypothetical protein